MATVGVGIDDHFHVVSLFSGRVILILCLCQLT